MLGLVACDAGCLEVVVAHGLRLDEGDEVVVVGRRVPQADDGALRAAPEVEVVAGAVVDADLPAGALAAAALREAEAAGLFRLGDAYRRGAVTAGSAALCLGAHFHVVAELIDELEIILRADEFPELSLHGVGAYERHALAYTEVGHIAVAARHLEEVPFLGHIVGELGQGDGHGDEPQRVVGVARGPLAQFLAGAGAAPLVDGVVLSRTLYFPVLRIGGALDERELHLAGLVGGGEAAAGVSYVAARFAEHVEALGRADELPLVFAGRAVGRRLQFVAGAGVLDDAAAVLKLHDIVLRRVSRRKLRQHTLRVHRSEREERDEEEKDFLHRLCFFIN